MMRTVHDGSYFGLQVQEREISSRLYNAFAGIGSSLAHCLYEKGLAAPNTSSGTCMCQCQDLGSSIESSPSTTYPLRKDQLRKGMQDCRRDVLVSRSSEMHA